MGLLPSMDHSYLVFCSGRVKKKAAGPQHSVSFYAFFIHMKQISEDYHKVPPFILVCSVAFFFLNMHRKQLIPGVKEKYCRSTIKNEHYIDPLVVTHLCENSQLFLLCLLLT